MSAFPPFLFLPSLNKYVPDRIRHGRITFLLQLMMRLDGYFAPSRKEKSLVIGAFRTYESMCVCIIATLHSLSRSLLLAAVVDDERSGRSPIRTRHFRLSNHVAGEKDQREDNDAHNDPSLSRSHVGTCIS